MPRPTRSALLAALTLSLCIHALHAQLAPATQPTVLEDADHRGTAISLDGDWHYMVDPYFNGLYSFHHEIKSDGWFMNRRPQPSDAGTVEYDFSKSPTLHVPGDWNTQSDRLFFYEGPLWYQRDFDLHPIPGHRTFLHVGAANYRSWFWINGKLACMHEGGFTAFDCEITSLVHPGANFIVAAVDNTRLAAGVPTLETDWWNYGGLTRDVSLVETPAKFIDSYDLHLSRADHKTIEGWVHVTGAKPGDHVTVGIPEIGVHATIPTDTSGRAAVHLTPAQLTLWSPENPKLYQVELSTAPQPNVDAVDQLEDEIGFRTIEARGTEILLNGKPIFLQGVAIHAEAPYRTGRANTQQDVQTLLEWAKDLGCNYVRLAHYPHDERMTRTADRLGILVWSEIPTYWAIHFDDPKVLAKAESQLTEEIARDRSRASIILWSVANETPATEARTRFLTTLANKARSLDPTRLVTAALLVRTEGNTKVVDDPLGAALDVIGANEYIGWYEGRPESADTTNWRIAYQKPLIMSELGGAAKAGLHTPAGQSPARWTEEYQADIYTHQLKMLNRIPELRGMSPWVLMDFRSPYRQLPGIQDYFNRKGLISDQGRKKLAFYVLQKAYQTHSVGKAASEPQSTSAQSRSSSTPARPTRATLPIRDPHAPGYVPAKDLPDGTNPPPTADGNFVLGPTHHPAPEMTRADNIPQGSVYTFTMSSADSKIYPGIARESGTFGTADPKNPARMIVTTSHPAPYTRRVAVYIPKQYVPGTTAPFIVGADGPDHALFTALDTLIAERRVPVMIAISIANGGGDAQGSERGLEYDTMSGLYAEFVEKEVLPLVESKYNVKLTRDPNGRATMGGSSGGAAAFIMAWYHPELYHRVLTYSGTFVNQQWPYNPKTPYGAWEFHERLIPNSPRKPIRIWMEVGDQDNLNMNALRDNMHDWVQANENMARVLAAKGYHYQFVFARNAGHTDRAVKQQTLPEALEYIWHGYPIGKPPSR